MSQTGTFPTSQRAAQITPPRSLSLTVSQTAQVPTLPSNGVYTLVRMLSTSLNPVDHKIASLPQPLPRLMLGSAPLIPGIDFVGRVWKTTHPDLKAGDICFGKLDGPSKFGTCADFTLHRGQEGVVKVPEGFLSLTDGDRSLEELGGVGVACLTSLQALKLGNFPYTRSSGSEQGGSVLINGSSGGTGTFAVQIAKAMGIEHIVATCSAANTDLVRSLGATHVIDYRSQNVVDALKTWSSQNNTQFDMILDNVAGDPSIYWESHHYLKQGGRFVQVGAGVSLGSMLDIAKMGILPGWLGGGKRPYQLYFLASTKKEEWELVGRWMVEGKLRTIIEEGNRFELVDIQKAFDKLNSGRTRGKIVVKISEDGQ